MSDIPGPPAGSRTAGKRLWRSVVERFELQEHELALLREAARTVDHLAVLDAEVRRDGPLIETSQGNMRAHPAGVEARQQRIALARLLAALRLPAGEEGDEQKSSRPQRRGVRGVYGFRGAAG